MPNYLVTGSAGFIGAALSDALLRAGHHVTGLDNLNDYYDVRLKMWRLKQLTANSNFKFIHADISEHSTVSVLLNHRFDAIINLAAYAGVRDSVANPKAYYQSNVIGNLNMLECARMTDVKKYIMASSSSVYNENQFPFRECNFADKPLSPYAASKKAAEEMCYAWHHLHNIDVTVLRFFSVYGPAGRPDMSILRFVHQIVEGETVYLYGDGRQMRDFTYIDDIVDGIVKALEKDNRFDIVNLGNDDPVKIGMVVELIEQITGKKVSIHHSMPNRGDMEITWADISKAKWFLKWRPKVDFEDGLKRVVDWYYREREWLSHLSY